MNRKMCTRFSELHLLLLGLRCFRMLLEVRAVQALLLEGLDLRMIVPARPLLQEQEKLQGRVAVRHRYVFAFLFTSLTFALFECCRR